MAAEVSGITDVTGTYYTTNATTGIRTLNTYHANSGDTLASVLAQDSAELTFVGVTGWKITK